MLAALARWASDGPEPHLPERRAVLTALLLRGSEQVADLPSAQRQLAGSGPRAWTDADVNAFMEHVRTFFERLADFYRRPDIEAEVIELPTLHVGPLAYGFGFRQLVWPATMPPPSGIGPELRDWNRQMLRLIKKGWKGESPFGMQVGIVMQGELRDVLAYRLMQLIKEAGYERFRHCECGRMFVRTGNRRFCSKLCQNRVGMKRQRDRDRLEREALKAKRGTNGKTKRT